MDVKGMASIYFVHCHLCHGMLLSGGFIDSGRHIFQTLFSLNVLRGRIGWGWATEKTGKALSFPCGLIGLFSLHLEVLIWNRPFPISYIPHFELRSLDCASSPQLVFVLCAAPGLQEYGFFFANILKYCIVCSWGAAGLIVFGLENNNTVFDSSLSHLVEAQLGRKLYFVYKIFTIFGPFQREFRAVWQSEKNNLFMTYIVSPTVSLRIPPQNRLCVRVCVCTFVCMCLRVSACAINWCCFSEPR